MNALTQRGHIQVKPPPVSPTRDNPLQTPKRSGNNPNPIPNLQSAGHTEITRVRQQVMNLPQFGHKLPLVRNIQNLSNAVCT